MVVPAEDMFGVSPPARSSTNKVTCPLTLDDRSDVLTWKQRNEMARLERLYAGVAPTPSPIETAFRHRHWLADRARVFEAMRVAHLPAARRDRFDCCGAGCVVEMHRDTKQMRVRGFYCGDRFCFPCAASRAARYRRELTAWCQSGPTFKFELTLRHRKESLSTMLDRLVRHFARIRRLAIWKKHTPGGCWTVEIKRGSGSRLWHVHIHGLARGPFISEDTLRRIWKAETLNSFQVKVRAITDPAGGAGYVCKYITKGWTREVLENPADLGECLRSLGGRRLLATFGGDRPPRLEDQRPDPARWKPLGRLVTILDQAGSGDLWACGVISVLTRARPADEGPTLHPPADPPWDPPD